MADSDTVKVWDPLVRLFHWSLAAGFLVAYGTQEIFYDLHLWSGYLVLGLIGFRLVWGLVGPRHARFADFVRGPRTVVDYVARLRSGGAPRYLGHNPAGGAMIVALLACLALVGLSGVALDAAENRAGPLAGWDLFRWGHIIEEVHEVLSNLAVVLILGHLAGVLLSSLIHRENLVRAMVTGRKRRDLPPQDPTHT
ncbi:MAG: cytochrome b/b6 domain-containing protein [Rhodobacterales bacterium]|nr:cytochrome b/b6 domain-containing protein [Rhodobacterales bacterium]